MDEVREEFEWFADWADGVSPLYTRLASAVTANDALLDIAAEAPAGQPPPNLLFGAVHARLLDDADHTLAEFYRTCTDDPLDPTTTDPAPAFREFCLANEPELRETVGTRRVQTNEVGRSAVLFPAFNHVARRTESPLALIEVGTSAGLNLYWDRFRYEYDGHGPYGDPDSPVRIDSSVRGTTVPPVGDSMPTVAHRVGIDVNPLDVTDERDARWLRALVIPDQYERFERLDAAIGLASREPPALVDGDALDVLPELFEEIPRERDVCVFSTLVLYQFAEEDIERLRERLAAEAEHRTVHWLSNDPTAAETPPTYRYASFEGAFETTRLAEYKAHGEWVRWVADES